MQLTSAIAATGPGTGVANAGAGKKFKTLAMYVTSAAPDTVVQLQTSPDNTTWTTQDAVTGTGWGYAAMHTSFQYVRPNCTVLGTGGKPVSAVITGIPA